MGGVGGAGEDGPFGREKMMIDPKRTTRAREENSLDCLYQQAGWLLYAAGEEEAAGHDGEAVELYAQADRLYVRAENLDNAIQSGYYGR